jgi:hypothetical protein
MDEFLAGGDENFEMDHFRPKSRFPGLEDDFYNIYYACHPCNHMKRDCWPPADLEARGIEIVDLCNDDFGHAFQNGCRWNLGRTERICAIHYRDPAAEQGALGQNTPNATEIRSRS